MPDTSPPDETLYLIDGHAQIFRAYFAIRGGLSSPVTGEPTHAVFGFAAMLLKLFNQFQPHFVAMPIDVKGKTFRDEMYPEYKATRESPPEDFASQEQRIFELTKLFGIPIIGVTGAEADDVIATIATQICDDPDYKNVHLRVVSKDKDLEQLLCDRVTMFDIHTDTEIDEKYLLENKGITPQQVVDALALTGDKVDNIPGVDGVGMKTACKLLQEFGTLENLLNNLDKVKGKRRENLEKAKDKLPLSRKLVQLKHDVPLSFKMEDARVRNIDGPGIQRFFEEMGFRRHQTELQKLLQRLQGKVPVTPIAGASGKAASAAASAKPGDDGGFPTSLFGATDQPADTAEAEHDEAHGLTTATDFDYRIIKTKAQLDELADTLAKQPMVAFDTETINLDHRAQLCGLSFSWKAGEGVYVPICSPQQTEHLDEAAVLGALRAYLEDPKLPKCGHNLKYDMLVMRAAGIKVRGATFDTMIASFLLGLPAHSLDALSIAELRHRTVPISKLIGEKPIRGSGLKQRTMEKVPLDIIGPYAAEDADVTLRLYELLAPRVQERGMDELSRAIEMPLVAVLAEMEFNGIRVDPDVLAQQKAALADRIIELRKQVMNICDADFNLDSPKQLADVLFNKLGLPVIKKTKSGPSTDVEVLEKLADHEDLTQEQATVPRMIVEYRQLTKLVGTYLDALRDSIRPETGRIHATFHQTGAATGRLSSSGPNLQNIPIRTDIGRQIRKAFVADPGHLLISSDYSQIELRMLAHLSEDPALIKAFENDDDIHRAVAAEVFDLPIDEVTSERRNHAKVINFGIIYGVTPYGLARRIEGMDRETARKLIADYRARFAGIDAFLDQCIEQATQKGYVTTIFGRRRSIPQVKSNNPNMRALGERLAINSVVQGSAADLIKLAMVQLQQRIDDEKLPMKLLLQIHDELVVEAREDAAPEMSRVVVDVMENAMNLRVPLKVEAGTGPDWLSAK